MTDDRHSTSPAPQATLPELLALVAAMAAAWTAAGSVGLLAGPLRVGLTWLALGVAAVAVWPRKSPPAAAWALFAAAVAAGLAMTAVGSAVAGPLAVAVVTAALARIQSGPAARMLLLAALAAAVLGVYHLAYAAIPAVWLAANAFGHGLGRLAGAIAGKPLAVGATFGGIDFLVLMAVIYGGWLVQTADGKKGLFTRAAVAAAAILGGLLGYLVLLAHCRELHAALPEPFVPPPADNSNLGAWTWGNFAHAFLPWHLPAFAAVVQAAIAAAMFRVGCSPRLPSGRQYHEQPPLWRDALTHVGPLALAVAIPLVTALSMGRSELNDKTIVAHGLQPGDLDPAYLGPHSPGATTPPDEPAAASNPGRYAALPWLIESLGGRLVTSAELSEQDLTAADVLLLVHPRRPWAEGQLERVHRFVRQGGSLLVAAEPRAWGDSPEALGDLLAPTAMRVGYDTAIPAAPGWEDCLRPLSHPATCFGPSGRNGFGLSMGPTIRAGLPARPMLSARFAFRDPGIDAMTTGVFGYDPGERLGDLVLAAEQRLGRGRVVVLGEALCLQNASGAQTYRFTGRLLGYLAHAGSGPQAWWRQLFGVVLSAALVGLLAWRPDPWRVAGTAVVLAVTLGCVVSTSRRATEVRPVDQARPVGQAQPDRATDGLEDVRQSLTYKLAYIDASHLEAYSSDALDLRGLEDFIRTLIRSGYLPLFLPELSARRLEGADVLISIGPARPFSPGEREAVRQFVDRGGRLIVMAGAEESAAANGLLADFDFYIPPSPVPPQGKDEPAPMGCMRTRYPATGEFIRHVQFYAAWPVEDRRGDAEQLTRGFADLPIVLSRRVGRGRATVIGDTCFAINENLETAQGGQLTENVHYFRWLLSRISDQQQWIPPQPADQTKNDEPTTKN